MKQIDIDQKVAEINDPLNKTRDWGIAKRDNITFRNRKMKARQFIRIVENSLPKLTKIDTGEVTDHRDNIKKAYCKAGLVGIQTYEKLIWGIFKASSFTQELKKLSVRTKNVLKKAFGVLDADKIDLDDFASKPLEEILNVKGAGAKTKEELIELRTKFVA